MFISIGAIPPLGAFVGSMCSGPLMQRAGRKRTLLLTAPLWAASWLILGFAPSFALILLGRIMSGLCVGFVLAPAQVYVSLYTYFITQKVCMSVISLLDIKNETKTRNNNIDWVPNRGIFID